MKLIYDEIIVDLSEETINALKTFVIGIMDSNRQARRSTAYCWNYCLIEFQELQPSFSYGGFVEDVIPKDITGPCILVEHPEIIRE